MCTHITIKTDIMKIVNIVIHVSALKQCEFLVSFPGSKICRREHNGF